MNHYKRFRFIALLLATALIASGLTGLIQFSDPINTSVAAATITDLQVTIDGPDKIPVHSETLYTAVVGATSTGNLVYSWSIEPVDSKIVFEPDGITCNLTFVEPTSDPYVLKVEVRDKADGFGVATKVVRDPASFPENHLSVFGAPYSYMVCVDESGAYYYAVEGKTGLVKWSSTDAGQVIRNATANGGKVSLTPSATYTINSFEEVAGGTDFWSYTYFGVTLSSNSILDGQGATLKLGNTIAALANAVSIIGNKHQNGDSNITIQNLVLNGNIANQPNKASDWENLNFKNVTDFTISKVTTQNSCQDGMDFDQCSRGTIIDCHGFNNNKNSFHPSTDSSTITFSYCTSNGTYGTTSIGYGDGFGTVDSVFDIVFDHCTSTQDMFGFRIDGTRTKLDHCNVFNPLKSAVRSVQNIYSAQIDGGYYNRTIDYATREYMFNFSTAADGVVVNASNVLITNANIGDRQLAPDKILINNIGSGSQIIGCQLSGYGRTISVLASADNIVIEDNFINGFGYYPVNLNSATNVKMYFNNITSSAAGAFVRNAGTGYDIKFNTGYRTEGSIVAANTTAVTVVFNHGLAATVTHLALSSTNTRGLTWQWSSSDTQVTITFDALTGYTLPATYSISAIYDCYP